MLQFFYIFTCSLHAFYIFEILPRALTSKPCTAGIHFVVVVHADVVNMFVVFVVHVCVFVIVFQVSLGGNKREGEFP